MIRRPSAGDGRLPWRQAGQTGPKCCRMFLAELDKALFSFF